MSLRSLSQQPPSIGVKCDRLQPRIEPVTWDLQPVRGTTRLWLQYTNRVSEDFQAEVGNFSTICGKMKFLAVRIVR